MHSICWDFRTTTAVYTQSGQYLGEVTAENDALGTKCLSAHGVGFICKCQIRTRHRMAFEQAVASNADMQVKEQAAYNYAFVFNSNT